jgi:hypothetical protein
VPAAHIELRGRGHPRRALARGRMQARASIPALTNLRSGIRKCRHLAKSCFRFAPIRLNPCQTSSSRSLRSPSSSSSTSRRSGTGWTAARSPGFASAAGGYGLGAPISTSSSSRSLRPRRRHGRIGSGPWRNVWPTWPPGSRRSRRAAERGEAGRPAPVGRGWSGSSGQLDAPLCFAERFAGIKVARLLVLLSAETGRRMRHTIKVAPRRANARGRGNRTVKRSTRQATYRFRRLPSSPDRTASEPRHCHATERSQ